MNTAAMIEQAKAERITMERLAIDARQTGLQTLVDVYCRSIIRLNAIIKIAEMQLGERKQ